MTLHRLGPSMAASTPCVCPHRRRPRCLVQLPGRPPAVAASRHGATQGCERAPPLPASVVVHGAACSRRSSVPTVYLEKTLAGAILVVRRKPGLNWAFALSLQLHVQICRVQFT